MRSSMQRRLRRHPSPLEPRLAVVTVAPPDYPHSRAFEEVSDALHFGLARAGFDSVQAVNRFPAGRTGIVLGASLLVPGQQLPPDSVIFNLEQIARGSSWLTADYIENLRRYKVWDYSEANAAALRELGVADVSVVELGYVPELTRITPRAKTIDVLFYGSVNERRNDVLQKLHGAGARVRALFGVYGADRDELIAQARIVLNIHFYESRILEIVRVGYLLANRAFVVTEESADSALERELEGGIVAAPYADLVGTCLRFIDDHAGREAVARRGFEIFSRRDQAQSLAPAVLRLRPLPR
jgi:hypothetical protein